jgi:fructose-bisphosphate aldolase class 1
MDESNGTCGKRLDSIGVENTEDNRRSYRELLVTTPGLGEYISGAILFEETLYQSCSTGKTMVEELNAQGIVAGIKVWFNLKVVLSNLLFVSASPCDDLLLSSEPGLARSEVT